MKNLSGFTIIVATIFSTIIHFFVLALFDTIPLLPKEIPLRSDIFMVDIVTIETASAVPFEEEKTAQIQEAVEAKKPEEKKEVKKEEVKKEEPKKETVTLEEKAKKKDTAALEDHDKAKVNKESKEKPKDDPTSDNEQQLSDAIARIRQKVENEDEKKGEQVPSGGYDVTKVQDRVKSFWAIPDTLSGEGLNAVIIIEIGKNGELLKTEFEKYSGNDVFDQAVIRAIKKAAPFEPPPGSVPLKIGLRFP
ncbi:MAG: cell envelope integrity protein TolA [Deltaproteobacteria bacterium]|nr:cell envelope integrity protein TolA [Deltaproteobacteria bacterium]